MDFERFEYLMAILRESGDLTVCHSKDGVVDVTFEDFLGFNDDWSEEMRSYKKPELVEELEEFFEDNLEGDYYLRGELFGVQYIVGYASYDI